MPRFPTLASEDVDPQFGFLWEYAFHGRLASCLSRGALTGYLKLSQHKIEHTIAAKELAAAGEVSIGKPVELFQPVMDKLFFRRGNDRPHGRRVIKSVHIPFCAEWVIRQVKPVHVVLILRHPMGTIASMQRLAMDDSFRRGSLLRHLTDAERHLVDQSPRSCLHRHDIRLIALQVFKMQQHLQEAAKRNPEWTVIRFEDLCALPVDRFRELFARIGCPWSPRMEAGIESLNRAGHGYQTRRIANQQVDGWKRELTGAEIKAIEDTFSTYCANAREFGDVGQ